MLKSISLTAMMLLWVSTHSWAQQFSADSLYQPPYLVQSDQFMMAVFHLDPSEVAPLIPEPFSLQTNEQGQAVLSLEMYTTRKIYGLPIFQIAFLVVDVEGYASANGATGRIALWGNTDSEIVQAAMGRHYGFPYSVNSEMNIRDEGDVRIGDIRLGAGRLNLQVEKLVDQPFDWTGIVNMVGRKPEGEVVWSEVPWQSAGFMGRVQNFELDSAGNPFLQLIQGKTPAWSMLSYDQVFTYTPAQTQ
ncbi:hypothetical protein [Pontibacter sp. G13]|uniref:hypothetical protein n=1 Tax=Pontibacter sp. G13 TaxID=3074898 RepID=UPI00288A3A3A|nr:hypothetical protein [Pontibacter sp. G13]WNJ19494.1 hypothetical protein RJD25_03285 [Pontibacter sp. G13]